MMIFQLNVFCHLNALILTPPKTKYTVFQLPITTGRLPIPIPSHVPPAGAPDVTLSDSYQHRVFLPIPGLHINRINLHAFGTWLAFLNIIPIKFTYIVASFRSLFLY